jgi:hypothetical protein
MHLLYIFHKKLRECVHLLRQGGLEVSSFVFVDLISLCELIDHRHYRRKQLLSFFFCAECLKLANSISGSFTEISVFQSFLGILPDSFLSGFMMRHVSTFECAKIKTLFRL